MNSLIVCAIFAAMLQVAGIAGQHKAATANSPHQATKDVEQKHPLASSGIIVIDQSRPDNQEARTADQPNTYLHHLFLPETLAQIGLVVAGLIGICVAVKTLKALRIQAVVMRRQASHAARQARSMRYQTTHLKNSAIQTRRAARAALLNAEAYMKSERPWLIIEIEPITLPGLPADQNSGMWRIIARNKGRTPAEMIDGVCGQGAHPIEDQVPTEERMAPFLAPLQKLTLPGDFFDVDIVKIDSHPIDRSVLPVEILYAYGRIRYWDTFSDRKKEGATPYETRWLIAYQDSKMTWYRAASDYSQNT